MTKRKRKGRAPASQQKKHRGSGRPSLAIPIAVAAVVLALIAGVVISGQGQRAQTQTGPGDVAAPVATVQAQATRSLPYPDVPRITLQETVDALEQGQAVLVDVRSRSSYDEAHAAGALSLPEDEILARLNELPDGKALILY